MKKLIEEFRNFFLKGNNNDLILVIIAISIFIKIFNSFLSNLMTSFFLLFISATGIGMYMGNIDIGYADIGNIVFWFFYWNINLYPGILNNLMQVIKLLYIIMNLLMMLVWSLLQL